MEDTSKQKGIKIWMLFEVQASDENVVRNALAKHIDMLSKEEGVKIEEEHMEDKVEEIEVPENLKQKGVERLYSCFGEVIATLKDLETVIRVITNYAPSSLEVLAPENYIITMRDMQEMLVNLSDFIHKLLSQGIGGIVIRT